MAAGDDIPPPTWRLITDLQCSMAEKPQFVTQQGKKLDIFQKRQEMRRHNPTHEDILVSIDKWMTVVTSL